MRLLPLLLLAFAAAGPLAAQSADSASEAVVHDVRFVGARALDDRTLQDVVVTHAGRCKSPFVFWACALGADWARTPAHLDSTTVRADVDRIQRLYADWGWPDAQVASEVVPHDDAVDVVFRITEGEPLRVRSLRITGLDSLPFHLEVPPLPLHPGDPYALPLLDLSERLITGALADRGYPFARIEAGGDVDRAGHVADIALNVLPGEPGVFDSTRVAAEAPLSAGVVRGRLAYDEGERFSTRALAQSQANLLALPIVKTATVEPLPAEATDSAVPVRVNVTTAKRSAYQIEGTLSAVSCVQFQGTLSDRYFLGRPRVVTATAGVGNLLTGPLGGFPCGGGGGPEEDDFTQPEYFFRGEWQEPVSPRDWLELSGSYFRQVAIRAYVQEGVEGRIGWARQLSPALGGTLAYAPSRSRNLQQTLFLCAAYGVCGTAAASSFTTGFRTLAPVSLSMAWAPRGRYPYPTGPIRGLAGRLPYATTRIALQATLSAAGAPTLSQTGYAGIGGSATISRRVGARWELAARARVGLVAGDDTLPAQVRLFGGGPLGVRGVPQNLLGPRVLFMTAAEAQTLGCALRPGGCGALALSPDQVQVRPTGGTRSLEASVEARRWISDHLQLALFADAGLVSGGILPTAPVDPSAFSPLVTPGIGVRVVTPLGAVRLDVAYDPEPERTLPVLALDPDGPGYIVLGDARYQPFTHGGATGFTVFRRRLQFQFSVGQTF